LALQHKSKKIANDRKNKQTNDQPVQHHCASCKTKMNLASLMPGGNVWCRQHELVKEKSKIKRNRISILCAISCMAFDIA